MPFLRGRTLCNQHQDKQTTPHRAIREPVVARTSENGVVIVARASAPCRTSALTNSSGRKISRPSVTRIGEQAGLPPTPRDAWSRSYAVANLFRRIQIFLAEMPGSAPTYKRECNVRRTGGIRRSPGDVAVASSRRHPIGHLGLLSCYTGHRIFSALSITGSVIRRWIDAAFPGHSADATVRTDVEAALSSDNSRGMRP
jgi:hypothetical protein